MRSTVTSVNRTIGISTTTECLKILSSAYILAESQKGHKLYESHRFVYHQRSLVLPKTPDACQGQYRQPNGLDSAFARGDQGRRPSDHEITPTCWMYA